MIVLAFPTHDHGMHKQSTITLSAADDGTEDFYSNSCSFFPPPCEQIPLPPDDVYGIWKAIADLSFDDTHGAFWGRDTIGQSKKRLLESAQIYVKSTGYADHAIHQVKIEG